MIEEDKGAEVTCRFCAESYVITEEELHGVIERRRGTSSAEGEA
jgi:hypothetical protein